MGVTPEHPVVEFTQLDTRNLHFAVPWMFRVYVQLCVVLVFDDPLETPEPASMTASRVILKFTKQSNYWDPFADRGGTPSIYELLVAFGRLRLPGRFATNVVRHDVDGVDGP